MVTFAVPCPKVGSPSVAPAAHNSRRFQLQNASPSSSLSLAFLQGRNSRFSAVGKVSAQLSKVTASNSNSVPIPATKSQVGSPDGKDESPKESTPRNNVPDPSSISAFMAQVSDLIKLVDSRDIVELQLKQLDCELTLRKKEALEPPQVPIVPTPTPLPHAMYQSPPPAVAPAATTAPASPPPSSPTPASPTPPKTNQSSHPPLKCPMAGTFYRSSAPGEPPFVKVGDKVQKGQAICIIEAMKLMNEIEADQTGTIAEILVDDGKPVSVDTPLFVIVP
ncbi:biotin carboxyl carrier protein of acetyl-CoA carboxylase 2, chloroplastic isoform X1 [Morus notabilis]|uniref:biotin carboxyl carrier protein of acetyl-CoA carboxylase 2, chloroplastic isoform X1 n=1 Tax=Morus notabilis TaxID=981085 RepID=UPI000CED15A0|nr:biotin carboxyl carrier protein of acetyl-CoA carboxylase 2, chloroplastic isoform X1 [Morus notabilis]